MGFSSLSLSQYLSSILFLFHFHTTISSSNYSSSSHFCAHDQSLSLLQFKESFSISSSASGRCQHPKTESWKEGTDCCLWDGVSCDLKTGHVTGLDLSCSMLYGTLHPNNSLLSQSSSTAGPLFQLFQHLPYFFSIWPVLQSDTS